jgi:hypothetical protein
MLSKKASLFFHFFFLPQQGSTKAAVPSLPRIMHQGSTDAFNEKKHKKKTHGTSEMREKTSRWVFFPF